MGAAWAEEACGCENRCRPNGSVVKLHGQGLRAEAEAARRLPACEARDAGGVTPCVLRGNRRLGRRTEAGPCQLLPRVSRPYCVQQFQRRRLSRPIGHTIRHLQPVPYIKQTTRHECLE